MKRNIFIIVIGCLVVFGSLFLGFTKQGFAVGEIFTGDAINITGNSATLLFTIDDESISQAGVILSENPGINSPPNSFSCDYLGTFDGPGNYEFQKGSLATGKTYYYQACGKDTIGGNYLGEEKSFTTQSDTQCSVDSVKFSDVPVKFDDEMVTITIKTHNCQEGIGINAKGLEALNVSNASSTPIFIVNKPTKLIPNSQGTLEMDVILSTSGCYTDNDEDETNWGHECINYLDIYNSEGALISSGNNPELTSSELKQVNTESEMRTWRNKGILLGQCNNLGCKYGSESGGDEDEDNWKLIAVTKGTGNLANKCILKNATNLDENSDVYFDESEGESLVGKDVKLNIQAENCQNIPLTIKLKTGDGNIDLNEGPYVDTDNDSVTIIPPESGDLNIIYTADEDDCMGKTSDYDCRNYVEIYQNGVKIFSSFNWHRLSELDKLGITFPFQQNPLYKSKVNFKKGVISYECGGFDSACSSFSNDWEFVSTNGTLVDENEQPLPPINFGENLKKKYDKKSPCYRKNLNNSGKEGYISNCYDLLAPIPGLENANNVEMNEHGRQAIVDTKGFQLGDYVNQMFKIALGLLIVLSVIMIVIAGVEYMTVESFVQKGMAKKRIGGALMGLVLGLGIVVILQTINPELLEVNFNVKKVTLAYGPTADTEYLNTIDVAGIPDVDLDTMMKDDTFVVYIAHQQGKAGATKIFKAVKAGKNKVPDPDIQKNVDNQFKKPTNLDYFLNYFYKRVKTFSTSNKRDVIPQEYKSAIKKAATEIGVNYETMITMCMIESYMCNKSPEGVPAHEVDNGEGYRGLFQFGETAWKDYGRGEYLENVFDPYENSLAGAKMFKDNISLKNLFK